MDVFYVAACQTNFAAPADRGEIGAQTQTICEMVEQTITVIEPFFDVRPTNGKRIQEARRRLQ